MLLWAVLEGPRGTQSEQVLASQVTDGFEQLPRQVQLAALLPGRRDTRQQELFTCPHLLLPISPLPALGNCRWILLSTESPRHFSVSRFFTLQDTTFLEGPPSRFLFALCKRTPTGQLTFSAHFRFPFGNRYLSTLIVHLWKLCSVAQLRKAFLRRRRGLPNPHFLFGSKKS